MNAYSELKADIDKLRAQLMLLSGGVVPGGGQLQALGNWVQYSGVFGSPLTRQPVPGTQTPDGTHTPCVAAAVLQTTYTGIYLVNVSVSFTDSSNNPSDIFTLFGCETNGPGVLSSTGVGGFVPAGTAGANAVNASSGLVGSDQGNNAGLLLDGVAFPVIGGPKLPMNGNGVTPASQGGGTGLFHWSFSGLVSNGSKVKTPFDKGKNVGFGLVMNAPNGNVVTIGHCAIGAIEWPFG